MDLRIIFSQAATTHAAGQTRSVAAEDAALGAEAEAAAVAGPDAAEPGAPPERGSPARAAAGGPRINAMTGPAGEEVADGNDELANLAQSVEEEAMAHP